MKNKCKKCNGTGYIYISKEMMTRGIDWTSYWPIPCECKVKEMCKKANTTNRTHESH